MSEKFGYEGGGGASSFPSEIFCLTVPKIFVGEPLSVALIAGTEKVWISEGTRSIKFFRRFFFLSQCRKFKYGGII